LKIVNCKRRFGSWEAEAFTKLNSNVQYITGKEGEFYALRLEKPAPSFTFTADISIFNRTL
jgi:hypothetical protein